MSDATNIEATEDSVIQILTNEPSEPLEIEGFNVRLVFQRPRLTEKYKGRIWANKKIKEIGLSETDDDMTAFFFRYWGTLNAFTRQVLVEDEAGKIKLKGKTYSQYTYDPQTDMDYSSLFEKYVMEEVFNQGRNEEEFVSDVIVVHAEWLNSLTMPKEDDVKNS